MTYLGVNRSYFLAVHGKPSDCDLRAVVFSLHHCFACTKNTQVFNNEALVIKINEAVSTGISKAEPMLNMNCINGRIFMDKNMRNSFAKALNHCYLPKARTRGRFGTRGNNSARTAPLVSP